MTCASSLVKQEQRRQFYGRRAGRPLSVSQKEAMARDLEALSVPPSLLDGRGAVDPVTLFSRPYSEYCFEIGFGGGEHLAALMRQNPDTAYIGAEPFINGMASFLKHIRDMEEKNARVLMDDAMLLARSLTGECLDRLYVLNPDPWHKTRHHKRRIINPANLDVFARILKPGGMLISSTDVPELAEWIVTHTVSHPAFEWTATHCKDWQTRPAWWPDHRYATKGARGAKAMHYLVFRKI